MKKLLVPVDFSESVKPAISFAANLARKTGAELYLIHIIDTPAQHGRDRNAAAYGSDGECQSHSARRTA
jgi:nucleotide-binding universal stress UspA family protein